MLQIKDIRKKYVTGELVQTALDGVSLNLRDNEFVAILGPSGSGKTTLLNVIGGLDRYDSGDLIINGISTKKYTDRDWDSYRNHTIGFVFQSYNLIPHQSVLANVELALTISGISRSERRKRAKKALEDVGLGNQLHKKPNQMSGGQMQRVAIARALVNDPDILLADEPTGALDSETSVQVMDLLKEVSKDRLVVMVTHNPELAEDYANRIVRVKDGRIIGDTNPYLVDDASLAAPTHKNMGKASMSFFTALSLSFNNLRTKLGRTFLTAFAGSIGIIGIALIMALSTGFQKYIDKIQEDTLSSYPLTLQAETADMGAAMMAMGSSMMETAELPEGVVGEQQMISTMFSQIGKNDLGAFKTHLEENYDSISHTIQSIKYSYGVKPLIYSENTEDILQVNPSTLFGKITGNMAMSSYMDSNVFYELIDNYEMLEAQYEVVRGRWPESYNEMVFVLTDPNAIADYMVYALGMKPAHELEDMIAKVMQGEEAVLETESLQWTYEELMQLSFRLVDASSLYRYNEEYTVWENMSDDAAYMKQVIEDGETLSIVGIVCPREGTNATTLTAGIAYTPELTRHVIATAEKSSIVAAQQADKSIDVFTGKEFGAKDGENQLSFEDMITIDGNAISSAFGMNISMDGIMNLLENYMNEVSGSLKVDLEPAQNAFLDTFTAMGTEMLQLHISQNGDGAEAKLYLQDAQSIVDAYLSGSGAARIEALNQQYPVSVDGYTQVFRPLLVGLVSECVAENLVWGNAAPAAAIPAAAEAVPTAEEAPETGDAEELPDAGSQSPEAGDTPEAEETPEAGEIPDTGETPDTGNTPEADAPTEGENTEQLPEEGDDPEASVPSVEIPDISIQPEQLYAVIRADQVEAMVAAYRENPVVTGASGVISSKMMESAVMGTLSDKLAQFGPMLSNYIGNAFYVNTEQLANAFQFNMDETELRRLMSSMSTQNQEASADANLKNLGYADLDQPTGISVYMGDFAKKEEFIAFLDAYNDTMEEEGKEDLVIQYTDITGIMMSSVRTIIDSVSYALIAFVAVSLVVSSIMIGIITYISVMERTKEIGVLRAIGASKRNISQVFNAETFIIGLCSGLLGVGTSLLILIPGNAIIHHLTNNPDIVAQLPVQNAAALILLSMVLTLIGGFIPARQAAKKDPVIALRSE